MSRPSNRATRPPFLKEQGERGQSGGGGGTLSRAEQCEQPEPGDGDPVRGPPALHNSLLGYQTRSPLFRTLSRSSSGYFSFDSEPSSPLLMHSASTQTPSPSSQVIIHALQRISEARGDAQSFELCPGPNHCPPHRAAAAGDMQAHWYIAQELRRIGDEFNDLYFRGAGRNGGGAQLPAQNEPAFILWMGLLIERLRQFLHRRR
ncbi:bcl-2-like protein 11 [Astyanax mexicanus]|uniref:BCL2 like 11 n=1 Tax=Astyanax mexicanus TaxID=7994 RepID=A0A3B1JXK6_ASTMX|nr:bcl-2-like protein 11 [Astyanax mexicanus]